MEKEKITKEKYKELVKAHWEQCDREIRLGSYTPDLITDGVLIKGGHLGTPNTPEEVEAIRDLYQRQLNRLNEMIEIV